MEYFYARPFKVISRRMNTCDIILPTYNAGEKLSFVLRALINQHIPDTWNIRLIVCDDGSQADESPLLNDMSWPSGWLPPVILQLPHAGRSATRNAGIRAASADILLFLADDIILRSGAIAEHLNFHLRQQDTHHAALGWVLWDENISPTPFMNWMTHGGQQNDYDALLGLHTCAPESFFYGSHMSLKRVMLKGYEFSEHFTAYGWEDLELGKRLAVHGLVLHVLHSAIGAHRHWYSAETLLARQRVIGMSAYNMNKNVMRRVVHGLYRYSGLRLLACATMKKWGNTVNIPRFFHIVTAGEFWYGVHHANKLLKSLHT